VSRIVAETREGSFGLLPHRLDCVAALVPGILNYETEADGEVFVAVDEGVLVKTGADVLVSVRRAMGGTDLGRLRDAVERNFSLGRTRAEHANRSWRNWKPDFSAASHPFNMSDACPNKLENGSCSEFAAQVGAKGARKLKARRNGHPGVWFGLGMMGLIGWSVAVPTLLGAALGIWLDKHYPGGRSWTLACWWRARDRLPECVALGSQGRERRCATNPGRRR
jgi:alternate F1F0 ATPase F1 subunit epsilon/predicted F0F1-ATPase subunit